MSGTDVTLAAAWILVAVLLIVQPWLTRKNVLFGIVFGSDGIWGDKRAKQIRTRYLFAEIIGAFLLGAISLLYFILARPAETAMMFAYLMGIVALLVFSTVVFMIFHAHACALKKEMGADPGLVSEKIIVETSLSDRQTVISAAWMFFFLPILLAGYGVAWFGYPNMPSKIPVHYSFTAADGWAQKSWLSVLLPLLIGTTVAIIIFICCLFTRRAPASVRGNPEAAPEAYRFRKYMVILLIVLAALMEVSFLLIEVGFLTPVSPLLFNIPNILSLILTAAIFYIYFRFVRAKKPQGPILDDDAKWVLGMFYYNPSDPSAFIEKRTGIGYTLNFARPVAWIMMIGIVILITVSMIVSTR